MLTDPIFVKFFLIYLKERTKCTPEKFFIVLVEDRILFLPGLGFMFFTLER